MDKCNPWDILILEKLCGIYLKFTLDHMSCILSGNPTPSRDFTRGHLGERALSVKALKEPVGRSFGKMVDSNFSNQQGHLKTPKASTCFHPCPHSSGISVSPKGPPASPAPAPSGFHGVPPPPTPRVLKKLTWVLGGCSHSLV